MERKRSIKEKLQHLLCRIGLHTQVSICSGGWNRCYSCETNCRYREYKTIVFGRFNPNGKMNKK